MTLKVDSIVGEDGTSPVTLTGQSAAKAWVNFNGTGTIAIRGSGLNISSLTDVGTGDYDVLFTSSMNDANYAASGNSGDDAAGAGAWDVQNLATGQLSIDSRNLSGTATDRENVMTVVMGDLA